MKNLRRVWYRYRNYSIKKCGQVEKIVRQMEIRQEEGWITTSQKILENIWWKPRIQGYTDGEPQFKIAGGCRGKQAPLKWLMAKDTDSMIFQPTEDGKWSCSPFTIVKFMELLLQLNHCRETVFMGKRSEARLTIDAWDTFLGMKFNAKNGIGWSFPGNTTDF